MRVGGVLRETVVASSVVATAGVVAAVAIGQVSVGIGIGAGFVIGSFNGHLVAKLLDRDTPFVAASVARLAFVSAVAILVALMLGSAVWSVLLGVGAAQLVMVAAAVRQGMRA